jgi:DNA-binding transcriptional LysR family regulator
MNITHRHPLPLLELDVLRTFVAIAETGNFSTAADVVFRTPSAVSMQIKKLEEQLGTPLFLRDARSVTMTQSGERLLPYARRMLAMSNEAVSRFVMPNMSGVVRLGAPEDLGERLLPNILKSFAESCPGIAVDVTIDNSAPLIRRLDEQRLDLVLFNGQVTGDESIGEVLSRENLVWAGAKGGTAHLREPLPISVWEDGCSWRSDAISRLEENGRPFRVAYMTAHALAQRAAIGADLAIAPLPRYMVRPDMTVLGERDGLPALGSYDIRMLTAKKSSQVIDAVADSIRWAFNDLALAA